MARVAGVGGGRRLFTCQSNVYLQILGLHQTVQTWMGNKCIILIKFFFFFYKKMCQRKHMHSCVFNYFNFYDMIYSFLLKNILYLQAYKNNKLFLSMSKLIPYCLITVTQKGE